MKSWSCADSLVVDDDDGDDDAMIYDGPSRVDASG